MVRFRCRKKIYLTEEPTEKGGKSLIYTKKLFAAMLAAVMIFTFGAVAHATESGEGITVLEAVEQAPEASSGKSEKPEYVDYSDLQLYVALANGLKEYDYTKESWAVLREALDEGSTLLSGGTQKKVTEAANNIKNAIAGLVKMDYSALEKNLGLLYGIIDNESQLWDLWYEMDDAVEKARPLLVSGDQAAVDNAVEELSGMIEKYNTYVAQIEPEIVIKEVEVEVPPSDDFCNIPGHRLWPVLFAISLVLNIALGALVFWIISKKRNTEDNIPLVSYDIDDDFDDMDDMDDIDDYEDYEDEEKDDKD